MYRSTNTVPSTYLLSRWSSGVPVHAVHTRSWIEMHVVDAVRYLFSHRWIRWSGAAVEPLHMEPNSNVFASENAGSQRYSLPFLIYTEHLPASTARGTRMGKRV